MNELWNTKESNRVKKGTFMHHLEIKDGNLIIDSYPLKAVTDYSIKRMDNEHVELNVTIIAKIKEDNFESKQLSQL